MNIAGNTGSPDVARCGGLYLTVSDSSVKSTVCKEISTVHPLKDGYKSSTS